MSNIQTLEQISGLAPAPMREDEEVGIRYGMVSIFPSAESVLRRYPTGAVGHSAVTLVIEGEPMSDSRPSIEGQKNPTSFTGSVLMVPHLAIRATKDTLDKRLSLTGNAFTNYPLAWHEAQSPEQAFTESLLGRCIDGVVYDHLVDYQIDPKTGLERFHIGQIASGEVFTLTIPDPAEILKLADQQPQP